MSNIGKILPLVRLICGILGMFPCLFILVLYTYKKNIRNFLNTLYVELCISCLSLSLLFVIQFRKEPDENKGLCHFQGTFLSMSYICSFLISAMILFYIYLSLIETPLIKNKKFNYIIGGLSFGLVILYAILDWNLGWNNEPLYGDTKLCWHETVLMRAFTLFILFVILIFNGIIIYLLIQAILFKLNHTNFADEYKKFFVRIIKYIIVIIIVSFPVIIDEIIGIVDKVNEVGSKSSNGWKYFREILESLSGFILVVGYCWTEEIKAQLNCNRTSNLSEEVESMQQYQNIQE